MMSKPCVWLVRHPDGTVAGCVFVDFMASVAEGKWNAMFRALAMQYPDLTELVNRAVEDRVLMQVGLHTWIPFVKTSYSYKDLSVPMLEALFNTYSKMTLEQVEIWAIERANGIWVK